MEKRKIFLDDEDYFRFVHDLFEFNDKNPAPNLTYYINYKNQPKEVSLPNIEREPRKLLVELMVFCLMENHYHLMVRQRVDNGITDFTRKLGTGYTNYFNKKYDRVGPLFQGKFKAVAVKNESHFLHLPYYIHANPLDLIMKSWRRGEIKDFKKALKFLENYRWSSFLDYIGKENFPSVTQREFLNEFYEGPQNYRKEFIKWLRDMNLGQISHLTMED